MATATYRIKRGDLFVGIDRLKNNLPVFSLRTSADGSVGFDSEEQALNYLNGAVLSGEQFRWEDGNDFKVVSMVEQNDEQDEQDGDEDDELTY